MSKLEKIAPADRARIEQCLALTFNAANDGERIAGLKSASHILNKYEMSLYDFYRSNATGDASPEFVVVNDETSQEVERLKRQLSELQGKLRRFEEENSELKKRPVVVETGSHKASDGFYTYDAFYSTLISHLGTPKRALSIFSEMTKNPTGRIQSWRRNNKVPEDAFNAISTLARNTPSYHQSLTGEHKRRIDSLSLDGKTDQQIADIMNAEFSDRTFNVNMIKGAKTQIRMAYLSDLKEDGKTREQAKERFLTRYPNTRAIDKVLDRIYPSG